MDDTPGIASDHALLLAAICAGKAWWRPFSLPRTGDVCVGKRTWLCKLDAYGCPILTDTLRAALAKAMKGTES